MSGSKISELREREAIAKVALEQATENLRKAQLVKDKAFAEWLEANKQATDAHREMHFGPRPKSQEHFVTPFHLRVVRIPNLQPAVLGINAGFPLAYHAFKVPRTDFLIHELALSFDVLSKHVLRARGFRRIKNYRLERTKLLISSLAVRWDRAAAWPGRPPSTGRPPCKTPRCIQQRSMIPINAATR